MKKPLKISIRAQIFFAFISVVVLISAVFSPYGFYTNVHAIRASVDERLHVAANGVLELLPERYHMRLLAGDISEKEYMALQDKLIDYKNRVGITFLYCVVRSPDGKYYFSLTQDAPPWTPCMDDSKMLAEIYKTRQIVVDHGPDMLAEIYKPHQIVVDQGPDQDYGIVSRTLLLPVETPDGNMFVIGADLNVDIFRPMIVESLLDFLVIMLLGLVLVVIVTLVVSKRISRPISLLSDFTKKLADEDFSEKLKLSDELPSEQIRTRELAMLADNVEAMRGRLSDYLKKMESETVAREKIESELQLAGRLQLSFLPGTEFEYEGVQISAFMKTARESGGDLYDFFVLPSGRLCFAIGDVAGKGIAAALFMARAMSLIRSAAQIFKDLPSVVKFINKELCQGNDSCTFLTFFIATCDAHTGEVKFINCGHNLPFLRKSNGLPEMMKMKPNCVLGVFEDAEFELETFSLKAGDTLTCYTDGVTEAVASDGSFYGEDRLQVLLGERFDDAANISSAIVKDVERFSANCEQADDISLLVLSKIK